MIVIYPDTNALHSDLLMQRKLSGELLDLLDEGVVEVRLSPVVVAEADRQVRESVEATRKEITTSVAKAKRSLGLPDASTNTLLSTLAGEITAMRGKALAPLLAHDACEVIEWSDVSAQDLVERELERRKPVLEKSGQSIGLRDTIIWHGLLELLETLDSDNDFVIFVSADGGFIKDGGLHDELEEEVDGAWWDGSRLRVASSLASAVLEAGKLASLIGEREGTLSAALIDYIERFDGIEWGSFPRNMTVTHQSANLPYGMEDAMLISVDGVEVDHVGDGNPAECIGYADFTLSGRMSPMDYMDADHSNLDMTGGDINGYEVSVEFTARAEFIAEIEFDLEPLYAEVIGASVSW
ncbi:PIN domain-containing protein [Microbacterium testaceum]|uniref:PIN domain-containing protein n=1 Tax=Microbacterium testaceum TaxID=2033 RepID=UPI0027D871DC|nr:PIN domain-containing protein [Microbacterium testaceum]